MKKLGRLAQARDFKLLLGRGRRIESPLFRVVVRPNRLPFSRFAFVAARAVEKRSVVRNRLRRRAREWIRARAPLTLPSVDCAIIFKKEAAKAKRDDFYEELRKTTGRI